MNVEQLKKRGRQLDKNDDNEGQKEEVRRDWFFKTWDWNKIVVRKWMKMYRWASKRTEYNRR